MPHFGFTSPGSWLSYRVGWLFGAGLTKVAREAHYLTERTKTASTLERSAWLYRCVISFALVGLNSSLQDCSSIHGWIMCFRCRSRSAFCLCSLALTSDGPC